VPAEHEDAERGREDTLRRLRREEELAAVEPVGEEPGPRGQEQRRAELQRGRDADRDARVVRQDGQDQPVLRDALPANQSR
jgi:hypothetical protein